MTEVANCFGPAEQPCFSAANSAGFPSVREVPVSMIALRRTPPTVPSEECR
jgi:hypothetical protein